MLLFRPCDRLSVPVISLLFCLGRAGAEASSFVPHALCAGIRWASWKSQRKGRASWFAAARPDGRRWAACGWVPCRRPHKGGRLLRPSVWQPGPTELAPSRGTLCAPYQPTLPSSVSSQASTPGHWPVLCELREWGKRWWWQQPLGREVESVLQAGRSASRAACSSCTETAGTLQVLQFHYKKDEDSFY